MPELDLPLRPPPGLEIDRSRDGLERFAKSHAGAARNVLGVVCPRDEAQIVDLVSWANRNRVALVPLGSPGGPRRRGGTRPSVPALIVDLSGMNRMIHADGRDAIALIEPGLTFPEFDAQLRTHGLRSIKPLLPRRSKSVLAAYLEREPTIAPRDHWDSSDPLSALSITFGSGETFQSGTAGIPGSLDDNLKGGNRQMMSPGPIVSDYTRVLLGSQGTLGIVGWASIYCEPIPAREEAFLFGSDGFGPVAELARLLALRQLGAHCFLLDRAQAVAALGQGTGGAAAARLPAWLLYVSLSAPGEMPDACMAWQTADLAELACSAGAEAIGHGEGGYAQDLERRLQQLPDLYYKDAPRGAHHEAFCLTQIGRVEDLIATVSPTLDGARERGFDVGTYVQPIVQGSACHLEFTLFHEPSQAGEASALVLSLIDGLADAGGFLSRPYGAWSEIAYARDPNIVPHLRTVKDMFDPNGVLNPGKLCF